MTPLAIALRLLAREEYPEGREALRRLVEQSPRDAVAWAYLSGAELALADVEAARRASDRALALDPDGFAPHLKAGELAFRLGDLRLAETRFLAALRAVEPGTPEAAAARRALVAVRSRLRGSIAHGARLPRMRLSLGWFRRHSDTPEGAR
jgi:tetratricopeptide (TPR) repeat protein